MEVFREAFVSPFGSMQIGVDGEGVLVEVWLPNKASAIETPGKAPRDAVAGLRAATMQLMEYFNRGRRDFDLALRPHGSVFEQAVWQHLREIPYGEITSYGAIATELGLVNGARAVGSANGSNPIPIVIPCHRVIGSDGRLTGYGGGLPLKRALLELEGAIASPDPRLI